MLHYWKLSQKRHSRCELACLGTLFPPSRSMPLNLQPVTPLLCRSYSFDMPSLTPFGHKLQNGSKLEFNEDNWRVLHHSLLLSMLYHPAFSASPFSFNYLRCFLVQIITSPTWLSPSKLWRHLFLHLSISFNCRVLSCLASFLLIRRPSRYRYVPQHGWMVYEGGRLCSSFFITSPTPFKSGWYPDSVSMVKITILSNCR